jgi:hypothetical protein
VPCPWGVFASAYHDNELEPSERVWFEEHLLCCAECALDLRAIGTIQRIIQSINKEGRRFDPSEPFEDATVN